MTKAEKFREYAKEALGWSYNSHTEDEKRALIALATTWTQAALHSEMTVIGPPEHKIAA